MITDLFHIIHHVGMLMNKADPASDSEVPFIQFKKYAKTITIENQDGKPQEVDYCPAEDVPKMLMGIFSSQPDQTRIDAAKLLEKYADRQEK